jgi:hypothetical protein
MDEFERRREQLHHRHMAWERRMFNKYNVERAHDLLEEWVEEHSDEPLWEGPEYPDEVQSMYQARRWEREWADKKLQDFTLDKRQQARTWAIEHGINPHDEYNGVFDGPWKVVEDFQRKEAEKREMLQPVYKALLGVGSPHWGLALLQGTVPHVRYCKGSDDQNTFTLPCTFSNRPGMSRVLRRYLIGYPRGTEVYRGSDLPEVQ